MPMAVMGAATAFAGWVSAGVYSGATALGFSAATASTLSIYAAGLAYAAVGYGAQALVAVGLGALAQAQIPDTELGKQTRKQTRPLRFYMVGGTSRCGEPYFGGRP